MASVLADCDSCGGSGLYRGFAEPEGVAVICLRCDGSGCRTLEYTPFTARKDRSGIREVKWSSGSFIATGVGPRGHAISYEAFKRGERPPR